MKQSPLLKCSGQNPVCVASGNQRILVADILAEDEDEEEEERGADIGMDCRRQNDGSTSPQWSSPGRVVARWLAALRRTKERRSGMVHSRHCLNGLNGVESSPSASESEESGHCKKDKSFNLGVGCSLLYLMAATKNELNKMVEVRTEMEMLLQNVKEGLHRNDAFCKPFESLDTFDYSTTDLRGCSNFNSRLSIQSQTTSFVLSDSEPIMLHDNPLKCNTRQQEEYVESMDELEAELEAELEYLQIHLDRDDSLKDPHLERIKVTDSDTASVGSRSLSFGEIIDPQNASTELHYGVPPTELERRLHELVEARQQERIKELEVALECAMLKLREKEREVSWWKDTARLISRRTPGTSGLCSQDDSETS